MLKAVKEENPNIITKSSIMLGLGETDEEVKQTMEGEALSHHVFNTLVSYV